MSTVIRRLLVMLVMSALAMLATGGGAAAGTFPVIICGTSPRDPGDGLSWSSTASVGAGPTCPAAGTGLSVYTRQHQTFRQNATGAFKVTAPSGITVYGIHVVNAYSGGMGVSNYYGAQGWWGEFYWNGGPGPVGRSGPLTDAGFNRGGCCSQTKLQSRTIGWFLACGESSCPTGNAGVGLTVGELDLTAEEDQAPSVVASGANNLWYQNGWIRGTWPASFTATDPSGVCGAGVVFGSLTPILTPTPDTAPNRHTWKQCPDQQVPAAVDTTASDGSLGRGQGAMQLRLLARNTAGVTAAPAKAVYVDNSTPTIALSGPTDAASTAGTQYVTATGSAGASGVSGVGCSVDGSPPSWYAQASARVAVAGVGVHRVTCYSDNNARDAAGNVATSAAQTWTLSIREPTVAGIGFARLVDALLCRRVRERVRVPGHWVTVRRHHKLVRVWEPAHTRVVTARRCHARVVHRRITVWSTVVRNGKPVRVKRHKTIRVVVFPHVVYHNSKRVGHGKRTTVSGWLGKPDGTALAGQAVQVLTAPDNGLGRFSQVAVAKTQANGTWSAALPAGPSRLVAAYYAGAPTLEPSVSTPVHVVVPAEVKLISVSPARIPWAGTVRIVGQLVGGYLPPGGALVRLRIGVGSSYTTYGVQEHVIGNGRFSTTYTFGAGDPNTYRRYWFQVASLPMGNFPWAPSASGKRFVLVGGHPS